MKKLLVIGLILLLVVSFVAAEAGMTRVKKFTGYSGWTKTAMESGDANFITNFGDGEIPLPGSRGTTVTLTKTLKKDQKTDMRYEKMSRTQLSERNTGACLDGEYRLTNGRAGHFYGAEKCVAGMWRKI